MPYYTLRYVAQMLEEDEAFLYDCSIEMFQEDGCLSAYDEYPASERSEPILVFTEDGIENLQHIITEHRALGKAPTKPILTRNPKEP